MQRDFAHTISVTEAIALNHTAAASQPSIHVEAFDETSLVHFCTFMDFYTRQCHDPFSASLTCAKQAEAVQITPGRCDSGKPAAGRYDDAGGG